MHASRFSAHCVRDIADSARLRSALLEKRRRYNRLYMRAWRADPAHLAVERANRERWHYERKLRNALSAGVSAAEKHATFLCGFCRKLPPVTRVRRLEIRHLAPRGYVEVRVPYCGEC